MRDIHFRFWLLAPTIQISALFFNLPHIILNFHLVSWLGCTHQMYCDIMCLHDKFSPDKIIDTFHIIPTYQWGRNRDSMNNYYLCMGQARFLLYLLVQIFRRIKRVQLQITSKKIHDDPLKEDSKILWKTITFFWAAKVRLHQRSGNVVDSQERCRSHTDTACICICSHCGSLVYTNFPSRALWSTARCICPFDINQRCTWTKISTHTQI